MSDVFAKRQDCIPSALKASTNVESPTRGEAKVQMIGL